MHKTILAIFAFFLCASQALAGSYLPNTGSLKLDGALKTMNIEAHADMNGFVGTLSAEFKVPGGELNVALKHNAMEPADLYMALKLSSIAGKPLDVVVKEYQSNKGRGWGVMAKSLGIKPGSREFHRLKSGELDLPGYAERKGASAETSKKSGEKEHGKSHSKGRDDEGRGRGHGKGRK